MLSATRHLHCAWNLLHLEGNSLPSECYRVPSRGDEAFCVPICGSTAKVVRRRSAIRAVKRAVLVPANAGERPKHSRRKAWLCESIDQVDRVAFQSGHCCLGGR